MATDFGTDVDCIADVPLRWGLCSGLKNLGNALARRVLFLREFLNAGLTPQQVDNLRARVTAAIEADDRVQSLDTMGLTLDTQTNTLTVSILVTTADGPFPLVLAVTALTVDILNNGVLQPVPLVAPGTIATPVPGPAGAPGGPGPAGSTGAAGPTGTGGGAGVIPFKQEVSSALGTEELVDQITVDFSKFAAGTLTVELAGRFLSSAGTATFKLYVGGNYDAIDGTNVLTGTTASGSFVPLGISGTFTNPTGLRAVKITITSSAALATGQMKEATLSITS